MLKPIGGRSLLAQNQFSSFLFYCDHCYYDHYPVNPLQDGRGKTAKAASAKPLMAAVNRGAYKAIV
jgi:hypothetical protein